MLQIKQKNAGGHAEWLVETRYTFGSSADNHYTVNGAGVASEQAALEVNGDQVVLINLSGGRSVCHNGISVNKQSRLQSGDEFSVGDNIYIIEDPKALRASRPKPTTKSKVNSWTLQGRNTAMANKVIALSGSKIIGRSHECDICLNVVHLSRRHARISVNNNQVRIEDLESANGTFVNGKRISTRILKHGDDIAFDTLHFRLVAPQQDLAETQRHVQPERSTSAKPSTNRKPGAATAVQHHKHIKARAPSNPFPPLTNPLIPGEDELAGHAGAAKGSSLRAFILLAGLAATGSALWFKFGTELIPIIAGIG